MFTEFDSGNPRVEGVKAQNVQDVSRRSALHGNGRRQGTVSLFVRCRCSVLQLSNQYSFQFRPKKKDSCVQVSEVKKIRVGRSKNIFILNFFLLQMYRG